MGGIAFHMAHPHVLVVAAVGGDRLVFAILFWCVLPRHPDRVRDLVRGRDLGDLPRGRGYLYFKDSQPIPGV